MNCSPYRTLNESRLFEQVKRLKRQLQETLCKQSRSERRADRQESALSAESDDRANEIGWIAEDVEHLEDELSLLIGHCNEMQRELTRSYGGIADPTTIPMPPGQPTITKFVKKRKRTAPEHSASPLDAGGWVPSTPPKSPRDRKTITLTVRTVKVESDPVTDTDRKAAN